ncbi:MAG: phage terminase small subunit P27 family [Eggerthellaceae bacterium]|nr:phage terminase small subunit P27 family [Eggerthellaceae bacterium]
MKGRKPKVDAVRRGGITPEIIAAAQVVEAEIVEAERIPKPEHVAENPLQSRCWDSMVGASSIFTDADIPLLEAYCFWYSVLRQAEAEVVTPSGAVVTTYDNGKDIKQNPDLRTAEKATNMLRQIGQELNLSPSARVRAGLLNAMTKSTQADIVKKTLDGYETFKKQIKALDG